MSDQQIDKNTKDIEILSLNNITYKQMIAQLREADIKEEKKASETVEKMKTSIEQTNNSMMQNFSLFFKPLIIKPYNPPPSGSK